MRMPFSSGGGGSALIGPLHVDTTLNGFCLNSSIGRFYSCERLLVRSRIFAADNMVSTSRSANLAEVFACSGANKRDRRGSAPTKITEFSSSLYLGAIFSNVGRHFAPCSCRAQGADCSRRTSVPHSVATSTSQHCGFANIPLHNSITMEV
jgi:hypothetical protein